MTTRPDARYASYRYPAEIIATAVWLYFRFPLILRMVKELLAARGIPMSYETVCQWARKFGREIATRLRRRAPRRGEMRNAATHLLDVQSQGVMVGKWAPRKGTRYGTGTSRLRHGSCLMVWCRSCREPARRSAP